MGIDARIRAGRIRSVYDRLAVTLAVTVVGGTAAAAAMSTTAADAWRWLALVVGLAAARMVVWLAYRSDPGRLSLATWEVVSVAGALVSGITWGLGVALFFPGEGSLPTGYLVWLFLLGAMCVGAATVHAVHVPTTLGFVLPATLPLAVQLAMQGGGRRMAYAAMVVLFAAALVALARRFGRHFDDLIRLNLALEQRTEELDSANARLRAEIADHRATGDNLRQAQKMEAVGRMTGGVAHDFNNLLAVIGGNLQLILRRAQGNEDVIRLASAAERAAERGARLTASLLSFAHEQRLRPEAVDLNGLVQEFAPLLRRTLGERMELVLELAPGPLAAMADAAHFQSALLNLVINTRDANSAGRKLTIFSRAVALGADDLGAAGDAAPGDYIAVTVCDTGPGMLPGGAAQAFEPFFATKAVGKGSGLDLSQVYGFARQSGGHASIRTDPDGGTAVSLYLPAIQEDVALGKADGEAAPAARSPAGRRARLRVLLVEDDADLRPVLRDGMAANGWEVVAVTDAASAQAVLDEDRRSGSRRVDVLVTDVMMPGGTSGVDLARSAARTWPDLPVLMISGYPAAILAAHGAREEEFDLLRKPFTGTELIARVQLACQRRHRSPETVAHGNRAGTRG